MTRPDPGLVNLHALIVITAGGMSAEEKVLGGEVEGWEVGWAVEGAVRK